MGLYHNHILPRLIHWVCGTEDIGVCRAELLADAKGTVLEIGFGSGTNLPHYSERVEKLLVVEPSQTALAMARDAMQKVAFKVEVAGTDGQTLALPDRSVDTVVITFTLCTIDDVDQTLREVARVLKPGGQLLFLEHGLGPDAKTALWQNRLNFLQKKIGGGCHLNRKIDAAIQRSPLKVTALKTFFLPKTPKTHGYLYQGKARRHS